PNDFVRIEIQAALDRNIPVVPILLDSTSMPRSDDLPQPLKPLARRQAWEIARKRFSTDLGGLALRLKEVLASRQAVSPGSEMLLNTIGVRPGPAKQDIEYCRSADGTSLAYSIIGSGPPLVKVANWLTHLEYDWESPAWGPLLHRSASSYTLIR